MIKGVAGVPRAGKTYFCVDEISRKYFKFDSEYSEWKVLKSKEYDSLLIISNIKNFKLADYTIDKYIEINNLTFEQFFSVPYWENFNEINPKIKIIILIDEAQRFFPSNYKNDDVLFFFQYHGHLGIDIYLTYQSWFSISRKITDLMEFEIRAVRQSLKLGSEFRYHFYSGMDKIGSTTRRANKMVFALYKSFDIQSLEKPPRPIRKVLFFGLILVVFLVFFTINFVNSFGTRNADKNIKKDISAVSSVSLSSSPSLPLKKEQAGGGAGPTDRPRAAITLPHTISVETTRVPLGGMWWGDRLVGIEFFGQVIPVQDFTYQFTADFEKKQILASVPDSVLAQIKPLQSGGFIRGNDGTFRSLGYGSTEPETGRAKHFVDDGVVGSLPK